MATAADIINKAFEKIQVEVFTTAQETSALESLNNLVSLLGADQRMYCVTSEAFTLSVADKEYTIGTSGQFDTVRPIKIISCYLRDGDDFDWPVRVNTASKDYNRMTDKSYSGRPDAIYFLPEYPLAKIIFNSNPDYAYAAYFEFMKNFTEFATTATTVTLPPEYKEGLVYNLAVSLSEEWGRTPSQTLVLKAEQYKDIIDRLNLSNRTPAKARFDMGRAGGGTYFDYNISTDDTIDGGPF